MSRVTTDSVLVTSEPHELHLTDRQRATRGKGAPHWGQVRAIHAMTNRNLGNRNGLA
ncbi:MAG TPA: hypothetical protein VM680_02265 [Verrucomicrobiae bacterium]|nr:hypothetical protein [Verrucomicrobiae bacterium]